MTDTTEMNIAISSSVQRHGNRVWIAGVPALAWGKSGETTFAGSLAAALTVVGPQHDYTTILGDSGLAFRLRWWMADDGRGWDNSSPLGEGSPWRDAAVRSIGWKAHVPMAAPGKDAAAPTLADAIASIDAGRPVLVYGKTWDLGVAYGYEDGGEVLLVRDYYERDQETKIAAAQVKEIFLILKERAEAPARRDAVMEGLRAAVRDWQAVPEAKRMNGSRSGHYHFGDDAYARWIASLKNAAELTPEQQQNLFRTGWRTLDCLHDARLNAPVYLRRYAPLFDGEARAALERAASLYQQHAAATGCPTFEEKAVFFGPWSGKTFADWTPEVRAREIAILEAARRLDHQATAELEKAL